MTGPRPCACGRRTRSTRSATMLTRPPRGRARTRTSRSTPSTRWGSLRRLGPALPRAHVAGGRPPRGAPLLTSQYAATAVESQPVRLRAARGRAAEADDCRLVVGLEAVEHLGE